MLFEPVRNIGLTLLVSAGIIGLFIGFAAQSLLSNLFASLQIAITQPIRGYHLLFLSIRLIIIIQCFLWILLFNNESEKCCNGLFIHFFG